jgi:iron(III) transport system ATP-binding protein
MNRWARRSLSGLAGGRAATDDATAATALQVQGLTRRFGASTALDEVSLSVHSGQFVVLLGPSGSGKTTLLRLVAGIDRTSIGTIRLGHQLVAGAGVHVPPERRGLAMVFQDYALWPQLTVLANVTGALHRLHLGRRESEHRALAMLERVGLAGHALRHPPHLSGGEQQRVALARALVARPSILLCDEPLSNLDADLREHLRVEIAALAREYLTTVVYITHDQSEAFALADRIGILESGQLVQYDLPEVVYHCPASPFVARFTGLACELPGRVAQLAGDGRLLIETAQGTLAASGPAPGPPGTPVTVMIRPAAVRLIASDDHRDALAGHIRDAAYRGRGYDHVVELAEGALLTGVFDEQRYRLGETVRVRVEPSGCFAFPDATSTTGRTRDEPATCDAHAGAQSLTGR